MLIDETFFRGLNLIPNIAEPEPNNRSAIVLAELINTCEEEVLSAAFGWKMYQDFKGNQNSNPYKSIVDGETYAKDGKEYLWKGLVDNDKKQSLIADYVFARYHAHNVTQQTEFGQVAADTKVGKKASSTPKITAAWNRFVEKYQGATRANGYTAEGNPFYYVNGGVSYYHACNDGDVSLLKYLADNAHKFPLLKLGVAGFRFKNSFGI